MSDLEIEEKLSAKDINLFLVTTIILGKLMGNNNYRLLRLKQVREKTGLPTSTIYKMISDGKFPKQIKLAKRTAAWIESEVNDWITFLVKERNSC